MRQLFFFWVVWGWGLLFVFFLGGGFWGGPKNKGGDTKPYAKKGKGVWGWGHGNSKTKKKTPPKKAPPYCSSCPIWGVRLQSDLTIKEE